MKPTTSAPDLTTAAGRTVRRGSATCVWNLTGRNPVMVVHAQDAQGRPILLERAAAIGQAQDLMDRVNGAPYTNKSR